jgi:hypothetical protein
MQCPCRIHSPIRFIYVSCRHFIHIRLMPPLYFASAFVASLPPLQFVNRLVASLPPTNPFLCHANVHRCRSKSRCFNCEKPPHVALNHLCLTTLREGRVHALLPDCVPMVTSPLSPPRRVSYGSLLQELQAWFHGAIRDFCRCDFGCLIWGYRSARSRALGFREVIFIIYCSVWILGNWSCFLRFSVLILLGSDRKLESGIICVSLIAVFILNMTLMVRS